jgi:hypothetical protein
VRTTALDRIQGHLRCHKSGSGQQREKLVMTARVADLGASLVVAVAMGVAPESSFCFLSAVYELVL